MLKSYLRWKTAGVVMITTLLVMILLICILFLNVSPNPHANQQHKQTTHFTPILSSRIATIPSLQLTSVALAEPHTTSTPKKTQKPQIHTTPTVAPVIPPPPPPPTSTPTPTPTPKQANKPAQPAPPPPPLTPAQIYTQALAGSALYGLGPTTISSTQSGTFVVSLAEVSITDFTLQADITMTGDGGGLVFRWNGNGNNRFRMGLDGTYDLASPTGTLITGNTKAITQGSNQLTIIAHGQIVYIYINQQFIGKVTDSDTTAGEIGCMATDFSQSSTVTCSNFRVLSIPAGARF